ncbi:hypothetical protein GEMRC1_003504 [Eukaryota sp. GEM-RC1]
MSSRYPKRSSRQQFTYQQPEQEEQEFEPQEEFERPERASKPTGSSKVKNYGPGQILPQGVGGGRAPLGGCVQFEDGHLECEDPDNVEVEHYGHGQILPQSIGGGRAGPSGVDVDLKSGRIIRGEKM